MQHETNSQSPAINIAKHHLGSVLIFDRQLGIGAVVRVVALSQGLHSCLQCVESFPACLFRLQRGTGRSRVQDHKASCGHNAQLGKRLTVVLEDATAQDELEAGRVACLKTCVITFHHSEKEVVCACRTHLKRQLSF